jgi:hypothetical protein
MPTFSQLPGGKWRVQVRHAGLRRTATFATEREAQDWAAGLAAHGDAQTPGKAARATKASRGVTPAGAEAGASSAAPDLGLGRVRAASALAPRDPSRFVSLHDAARSMRVALAPFILGNAVDSDAATLLAVVQAAEGFPADHSDYRTYLVQLSRVAALLEAACGVLIARGPAARSSSHG